jgi:putative membrane protein
MTGPVTAVEGAERRFDVRPTSDSHFSWLRTRLAVESTLMSWMRTAISLFGFGFTIVQFFDRVEALPGVSAARFPGASRYLGLTLIFCGVAALVISIVQYRWSLKYLWSSDFRSIAGVTPDGKLTATYASAMTLIIVGTLTFFSLLFRLI